MARVIAFAGMGLLIGALLGCEFTILSLIPATLLCGLFGIAARAFGAMASASDVVLLVVSLEAGYVVAAWAVLTLARGKRLRDIVERGAT